MIVTAFIQARMSSTRLPGKVMKPLAGEPMLWRIIERVRDVLPADRVRVVTSTDAANKPIRKLCDTRKVPCFSGDEDDVLDRFVKARSYAGADYVLRITADCPVVDPDTLRLLIQKTELSRADYGVVVTGASAVAYGRYPDGFDAELLSPVALDYADKHTRVEEREHVTRALWREPRPVQSCLVTRNGQTDLGPMRLTVDTEDDYRSMKRLYDQLYRPDRIFGLPDILSVVGN